MKFLLTNLKFILLSSFTIGAVMTGCATQSSFDSKSQDRISNSPQFNGDKFKNAGITKEQDLATRFNAAKDFLFNKSPKAFPENKIPLKEISATDLNQGKVNELNFSRLGHSTLLIELDQKLWLTDPVFSERVSPVQWAGPQRFHPTPISVEELPNIEGVIISHNHYDHLDYGSIQKLKEKVNHFIVPLGIAAILRNWGVAPNKIIELDWWQKANIGNVELVSTPAQHFSGRGLLDGDKTLWSSWVIKSENHSIYFSGDTGYFDGFKQIGEQYGPFDYAFMECGAYNQLWRDIHMMPEDTLQAFKDVKGKVLVPIHNGTFDLSTHAWFDPFKQIEELAAKEDVTLLTPIMGEMINAQVPTKSIAWWKTEATTDLQLTSTQKTESNSVVVSGSNSAQGVKAEAL